MRQALKQSRLAMMAYAWLSQFADPLRVARGIRGLGWFWTDYRRYRALPGAEPTTTIELMPSLHERTPLHELDAHYFYVNAWAARRILDARPKEHLDVASQIVLAAILSASLPVTYLDVRPLRAVLPGLLSVGGSLLALPYADRSIASVSCLHVAEHIGLGRYGDPLDPDGTRKAARELQRVLAPGGSLYFAVPVGRPRVCFNSHRIHAVEAVLQLFPELTLVELSGVTDDGRYVEHAAAAVFTDAHYACGMFRFRRSEQ